MLILIPHCEQIPHKDSLYYYKQNQHLNVIKHVFWHYLVCKLYLYLIGFFLIGSLKKLKSFARRNAEIILISIVESAQT